jgi:hypothetical protein
VNDEEIDNICEHCATPFQGLAQKCDACGMDGLGECCASSIDHNCPEEGE